MHTFLWIFAFIGVALIYFFPWLAGKLELKQNVIAALKLSGLIIATVCLIALYRTGGFN